MADGTGLETDRAALLARYDLDAGGFRTLDQITDFAAALCDAPIALVSIVEDERQRFLARTGLDAEETSRDVSFCAHAMQGDDIFVVRDASVDPRIGRQRRRVAFRRQVQLPQTERKLQHEQFLIDEPPRRLRAGW